MKKILLPFFLSLSLLAHAQKIKKIYVDLYTDSLKKGTYNYINIDGLLANGRYVPLDTNDITFWCSEGKFFGNELLVEKDFKSEKVLIKITLKENPVITQEFTMYIKQNNDNEQLKTTDELLKDSQNNSSKNKKKG